MNVLTERPGWILHRCATELADRIPGVSVNASGAFDVVYSMPAHRDFRTTARRVGLFTHQSDRQLQIFAPTYQAHVAMNRRMADRLVATGAQPVVIRPGAMAGKAAITFGVCGRTYPTGRKGEQLVAKMVDAGFRVLAWGKGWPCPILSDRPADLPAFYGQVDYLVVTSLEEGGPMPVVDAIAWGVPIVAPAGVGWCDEFPCLRYERGHWDSLHAILSALATPPSWEAWAEAHRQLFARLGEN